ncbi:PPOX class F420-dependent oxidoreductase [Salinibacterium sp.]|uniref:PPOX class F420-dependent oxidoreductase n=1 Tax=Salinibacterium sp. TaxID=1915057 RepID=UPI00286C5838|nr:PPOX class F420-dependent oxidoreductase [Salinibacterium sp.]
MPSSQKLLALGDEQFVSLTTFRKSGVPVSTPVWIARDGDSLVVTTPASSGKVKRLRNSPRVQLSPCSRMGKVAEGSESTEANAVILDDPTTVDRLGNVFLAKFRLQYRIFMWIERRGKEGQKQRVMLRITDGDSLQA